MGDLINHNGKKSTNSLDKARNVCKESKSQMDFKESSCTSQ